MLEKHPCNCGHTVHSSHTKPGVYGGIVVFFTLTEVEKETCPNHTAVSGRTGSESRLTPGVYVLYLYTLVCMALYAFEKCVIFIFMLMV